MKEEQEGEKSSHSSSTGSELDQNWTTIFPCLIEMESQIEI